MSSTALTVTTDLRVAVKNVRNSNKEIIGQMMTYQDRKGYGLTHGLKGAALDKAHKEYRRALGVVMNGVVSTAFTSGQYVTQKIKPTASGGYQITLVPAHKVTHGPAAPVVREMSADETLVATAKLLGVTVEALKAMQSAGK